MEAVMQAVTEALFWSAALLVVYPYLGYPPLLWLLATLFPARARPTSPVTPPVTLVISAYNEAGVIGAKLDNALALDYPRDALEVLVVSDASTDDTDAIVSTYMGRDSRIRLLRQATRRGKSAGLNSAVEAARGTVIVFSDANAMYEADALRQLVAGFDDPDVGYVVGAALYYDADGNRASESEGLYWRLEMWLKRHESAFHSVVGGDGALYAIRKELFWPLKDDDISDFVNPLQIVVHGARGVFRPQARAYEHAGDAFAKEFRRKRRIVNRTFRAVCRYGGGLRVKTHARFLFMLVSHKLIRWFAMPLIALAWCANTLLLPERPLYVLTWVAITASMALGLSGLIRERKSKPLSRIVALFYYFYAVNLAGMLGVWDEWRGVRHATWDHIRQAGR